MPRNHYLLHSLSRSRHRDQDTRPNPAAGSRRRLWRRAGLAAVLGTVVLVLSAPAAAFADTGDPVVLAANSLPVVIANLRAWIMGILAAIATLFLVLAGVYATTAGGDPTQVDKAKQAFRNALIGYGLAVLAPIFLQILQGIVGG